MTPRHMYLLLTLPMDPRWDHEITLQMLREAVTCYFPNAKLSTLEEYSIREFQREEAYACVRKELDNDRTLRHYIHDALEITTAFQASAGSAKKAPTAPPSTPKNSPKISKPSSR